VRQIKLATRQRLGAR